MKTEDAGRVYGRDSKEADRGKLLNEDEARRIAVNIAKGPELLQQFVFAPLLDCRRCFLHCCFFCNTRCILGFASS
jgi:hypothetical protein